MQTAMCTDVYIVLTEATVKNLNKKLYKRHWILPIVRFLSDTLLGLIQSRLLLTVSRFVISLSVKLTFLDVWRYLTKVERINPQKV